jgi:hypothetical protein
MPVAPGRSPDSRAVSGVGTTNTSTAITGPAGSFDKNGDVGRTITGTGIPGGATIAAVASSTAATLSAAATATGTITATVGAGQTATYGFTGWSPVSDTEATVHTVAAVNAGQVAPSKVTDTSTSVSSFQRSRG